jgi:hypothetical protein
MDRFGVRACVLINPRCAMKYKKGFNPNPGEQGDFFHAISQSTNVVITYKHLYSNWYRDGHASGTMEI